jgi:hypothetical protein
MPRIGIDTITSRSRSSRSRNKQAGSLYYTVFFEVRAPVLTMEQVEWLLRVERVGRTKKSLYIVIVNKSQKDY